LSKPKLIKSCRAEEEEEEEEGDLDLYIKNNLNIYVLYIKI
jgi:hypothetical protein